MSNVIYLVLYYLTGEIWSIYVFLAKMIIIKKQSKKLIQMILFMVFQCLSVQELLYY